MTPTVPPRIFGILARKAPIVAVLRRGPSKRVALLEWNLDTDTVTLGQWLKVCIYKRRCDLSPDGRHFIYFAMDGRWQGPLGGSWTAVSRMPYQRALHIYAWGHCWNGGGLFVNDKRYWLNGIGQSEHHAKSPLRVADTPPPGVVPMMGEDPVTYLPRLARDGWFETARKPGTEGSLEIVFAKTVRPKWHLEKTFRMGMKTDPYGECYDDRHRLIGPGTALDMGGDWAEVHGKEILFARDGGLWRQKVAPEAPAEPRLVADLTAMTFAALPAPYAGVQTAPARPRQ